MRKILLLVALLAASFISKPVFGSIHGPTITCVSGTLILHANSMAGGGPGTWTSSDTSIARVTFFPIIHRRGVVEGVSAGTATITYTQSTGYSTAIVTISAAPIPITISTKTTIPLGSHAEIRANNVNWGTFTSSNIPVATFYPAPTKTGVDYIYSSITGVALGTSVISYTGGTSGCTTSPSSVTVTVVPAVDCISGTVTGIGMSNSLKVWLIKYNPSTHMLEAVDSILDQSSVSPFHYQFCGVGTDSFRIKASEYMDPIEWQFYNSHLPINCPTYHVSNSYWNTATAFYHTAGTNDTGKNITLITGTAPAGPGFIAGDVTTGANKGTSGGTAAYGKLVYCLNNSTDAVVQHTYTDYQGHYHFSNLAVGETYKIYPELLNYATTPYPGITLTTGAPNMYSASFVQHTVSHTITPVGAAVPGIELAGIEVNVFPNPSNGMVNIQWSGMNGEKADLFITDITGRRVFATTISTPQANGREAIDISALNKGLYYLTLKTGEFNYNTKLERL